MLNELKEKYKKAVQLWEAAIKTDKEIAASLYQILEGCDNLGYFIQLEKEGNCISYKIMPAKKKQMIVYKNNFQTRPEAILNAAETIFQILENNSI